MLKSRAIRSLCILAAAMTVGTAVLKLMESAPVRPPEPHSAQIVDHQDDPLADLLASRVPLQSYKWRNLLIHSTANSRSPLLAACHFVADLRGTGPVRFHRTALWDSQTDGRHARSVGIDWNANSVGICLVTDSPRRGPSSEQMAAVLTLVRKLQRTLDIPRDNVYLAGDIGQADTSPGSDFNRGQFEAGLLAGVN